ncbi:MAG: hypothetical protein AVDCRST_MAG30-145, partial [uncultured Solirubrobacteraceae bacterium]
ARRRAHARLRRGPREGGGRPAAPLRGGAPDRRRARRAPGRGLRRADGRRARRAARRPPGRRRRTTACAAPRPGLQRCAGAPVLQHRLRALGRSRDRAPAGARVHRAARRPARVPAHGSGARRAELHPPAPAGVDDRRRDLRLPVRAPRPADHRRAPHRPRLRARPARRHPATRARRRAVRGPAGVRRAARL